MDNILVSILIPCFNGEKYIDSCLSDAINQTYKNIEIIVIDDGSTDNTWNKLLSWKQKDQRIKIYKQDNCGLAYCRNRLIKEANGYYFFFLDIDDNIPHDAIEKLIENSNNYKNDIVVGRTVLRIGKSFKFPFVPTWRFTNKMTNGHYVKSNICPPWASIIKKDFFKNLNVNFIDNRIFEDIGTMTYVFLKSNSFKSIKNITYCYNLHNIKNQHDNQLSNFKIKCFKKINDLYFQTLQILDLLSEEKNFTSDKYKRYINGLFFQILPSNIFLLNSYTNDKDIKYLFNFNLLNLIIKIKGYEINFSKTFWKSLTYFYILFNDKKIIKDVNNGYFNIKKRNGKFLQKLEKNNKYNIISTNNINEIFASKRYIFYLDNINLLSDNIVKNAYICLDYNNNLLTTNISKIIYEKNLICFFLLDDSYEYNEIKNLWELAVGFIFKITITSNSNKLIELIKNINSLASKRLIFLIVENNVSLNEELEKMVDRIYYY